MFIMFDSYVIIVVAIVIVIVAGYMFLCVSYMCVILFVR